MPPSPTKEPATKRQPMSISNLCQQDDDEDDDQHQLHSDDNDDNEDHEFEELDQSPNKLRARHQYSSRPDPAEQLAAEALGDMASQHTSTSSSSPSSASSTAASYASSAANAAANASAPFISRMSSLPLVSSALKAYETGSKHYSKVTKQPSQQQSQTPSSPQQQQQQQQHQSQQHRPHAQQYQQKSASYQVAAMSASTSQAQFSGWRGVVATVGTASAAGVALLSDESMKSLKYCLQWLQYAIQHIDHQIGLLKSFLVSLANPSQNTAIVPSNAASTLASIKREVVETLRKVINVVSKYAGACLPDQAKITVRQFILSMPSRWATLNNESLPSTPISSPALRPSTDRSGADSDTDSIPPLNATAEKATRVLVLANESSDMLKSVSSIFKDTVDRAEGWMDKLRMVGMNPQTSEGLPSWAPTGFPNSMPGGFPGSAPSPSPSVGSGSGLEQYSLRQTQHGSNHHHNGTTTRGGKLSPRSISRDTFANSHNQRHAYRQKSVMSGDEDSMSDEEEEVVLGGMEDSDDDALRPVNGHGPMKRSMGSSTYTQNSAVRRRKKRGESAEIVAGLGMQVNGNGNGHGPAIKQEPL